MLRSVAAILLVAATGIQAIRDGDFGTWRVVAAEQVCDPIYGCRQSFAITSDGNVDNKLPGFSASCSNLGGCTVENKESRLELKSGCVPGSISLVQTVDNATNVWAAWGSAPWQSGKAGEFTIPVTKLHIYGE
ncbi:hypothetical protein SAMD00023353_11500150 [Rosellinia necatrix]|uniref:Uncharacterized protein n=1 Tax=Rosellinia necatrix TaxID=77044 RepID=A0A1W2TX62_ROSNE|nr:hypothetical protein SAMD00023353_11500150 [Rosellinia necatrix]